MMDITLLIKSFAGLSAVLAILIVLYLYIFHAKPDKKQKENKTTVQHMKEVKPKFSVLFEVIRDKHATQEELKEAVNLIIKYYGDIPKKRGLRTDPKFEYYSEILLRLCHHPNTNKDIILKFDRELEKRNPEYKLELEDSLTKGLDTRGM